MRKPKPVAVFMDPYEPLDVSTYLHRDSSLWRALIYGLSDDIQAGDMRALFTRIVYHIVDNIYMARIEEHILFNSMFSAPHYADHRKELSSHISNMLGFLKSILGAFFPIP